MEYFSLDIGRDDESHEFYVCVYVDDELVSEYYGESAADCFKHALHDQWPLGFAELFPDYLEWTEGHKTEKIEE